MRIGVVTLDRDAASEHPYADIQVNAWHSRGKVQVLYLSTNRWTVWKIAKQVIANRNSVIYLNSLFDPRFSLLPLLVAWIMGQKSLIRLAPRGELSDGALSVKSGKKRLVLRLSRLLRLHHDITWHATSETEVDDILGRFPDAARIHLIGNIPAAAPDIVATDYQAKQPGCLNLVFLSRITPMKNLLCVLEAVSRLRNVEVRLDIVGPVRDQAYWDLCQSRIGELPGNVSVNYLGEREPDQIPRLLKQYDLFFLPTLGENFGHVIVEALAAGCPVLISDQTPWNAVEEHGCGWIFPPDDVDGFAQALSTLAGEDSTSWMLRRQNAGMFSKQIAAGDLSGNYRQLLCRS
jgi:glycosyltransferase involved in cell wall biosynthesis